jgi:transcriptional regulator with XRE-family HTH domain
MNEGKKAAPPTLAGKLNLLLEVMHPATRGPYTYKEIALGVAERGANLSRARWSYLRAGSDTPDRHLLKALAQFFGVDPAYLLDDDVAMVEQVEAQLNYLRTMRDNEIKNSAARAISELSPDALNEMAEIIQRRLAELKRDSPR